MQSPRHDVQMPWHGRQAKDDSCQNSIERAVPSVILWTVVGLHRGSFINRKQATSFRKLTQVFPQVSITSPLPRKIHPENRYFVALPLFFRSLASCRSIQAKGPHCRSSFKMILCFPPETLLLCQKTGPQLFLQMFSQAFTPCPSPLSPGYCLHGLRISYTEKCKQIKSFKRAPSREPMQSGPVPRTDEVKKQIKSFKRAPSREPMKLSHVVKKTTRV